MLTLKGPSKVNSVTFSRNGKCLPSGSTFSAPGTPGTITTWDARPVVEDIRYPIRFIRAYVRSERIHDAGARARTPGGARVQGPVLAWPESRTQSLKRSST